MHMFSKKFYIIEKNIETKSVFFRFNNFQLYFKNSVLSGTGVLS